MIYRRITYIFFIVLFLTVAPLVVLYTQGYRYNFERNRIQKTGILIVSSSPKKAQVFLNGKVSDKKTPARIEKVLPGDYEITIATDGYHNWTKRLPIFENSTTFAEKIFLWKNSLPKLIPTEATSSWLFSPDNKKAAAITSDSKIIILSLGDGTIETSLSLKDYKNIKLVEWSDNGQKVILEAQKNNKNLYLIFNAGGTWPLSSSKGSIEKEKSFSPTERNIKWDLKNDNFIYSSNATGIWQTDLSRQKHTSIFNVTSTNDFLINGNNLYLFDGQALFQQDLYGRKNLNKLQDIKCADCRIINKANDRLILLDKINQKLLIIDPENRIPTITASAKDFAWLNDSTALFYNDWEIWIYHTDQRQPELITRLGQPIKKVTWHPTGKHIIFATDSSIKIIELDNRELRNTIELATSQNITDMQINDQGENLYFTASPDGAQKIYKLDIR